ncbi:MAG: polysaccharide biosynthesis protein [Pseudomonadota bacterium]
MRFALPGLTRPRIAFAHDVAMAAASFVAAMYLRVGGDVFTYPKEFIVLGTGLFTLVAAAVLWRMGLYRGMWRYASINDLVTIAQAVTLIILIFLPAMFLVTRLQEVPRSLIVINWLALIILLSAPRVIYRLVKDGRFDLTYDPSRDRRVKVVLVGAGDNAEMFIQAMAHKDYAEYRVVGILDDASYQVGRRLGGHEVLGGLDDLAAVVERLAARNLTPQRLIVAKSEIAGLALGRLVEAADRLGISVARLPQLTEFRAAAADKIEVRPIDIEDLLGRPQTVLDRSAMERLIAGRRVMVTGAGGTIGAELVRQVAELGPARMVLVDNSEFNLYAIDLELGERRKPFPRRAILADVRARERIAALLAEERPELVFHAAALKHVPMVEANPCEGALTNTLGTRNVAEACRAAGVAAMVLVSTDKAVNPASVMGATKRLAENTCQALGLAQPADGGRTRFVTVRFGNVLGSTGSVVPLFQRQLGAGGPLTVTHPDVERYFMTVREAVELVLQASALGASEAQSSGRIFVLDMGQPVRILDLARQMIRLAGLRPDRDIGIVFTGLRPGEKLKEELFHAAEALQPTAVKGVLLASPRTADYALIARALDELEASARSGDEPATRAVLQRLVPEFRAAAPAGEPARAAD